MNKSQHKYYISDFSPHLFWDVDRSKLDWEANKSQIVKRVLEYGLLKDWIMMEKYYGMKEIGEVATTLRSLDERALGFIAAINDIPKKSFRCYTLRQSTPRHWNF